MLHILGTTHRNQGLLLNMVFFFHLNKIELIFLVFLACPNLSCSLESFMVIIGVFLVYLPCLWWKSMVMAVLLLSRKWRRALQELLNFARCIQMLEIFFILSLFLSEAVQMEINGQDDITGQRPLNDSDTNTFPHSFKAVNGTSNNVSQWQAYYTKACEVHGCQCCNKEEMSRFKGS